MNINQLLIYCFSSFLIPFAGIAVGSLLPRIPYKKCTDSFWVEKARAIFPLRKYTINMLVWVTIFNFFLSFIIFPTKSFGALKEMRLAGAGITFAAALCIHRYYKKQLGLRLKTFTDRLNRMLVYHLLIQPHLSIIIITAIIMPAEFSRYSIFILLIAVLVILFFFLGFTFFLAKLTSFVLPAPDNVQTLAKNVAGLTGLPTLKGIYIIPWKSINGFAFPFIKQIGITEQALSELNDEEISAIIAHECGHCKENPLIQLLRTVQGLLILHLAAALPVINSFGWFPYVCIVYGFLIISGLINKVRKKMEMKADLVAMGVEIYKIPFARALEKVARTNLFPVVLGRKSIHGELYDRMENTGIDLSYEKPEPPAYKFYYLGFLIAIILDCVLFICLKFLIFS